MPFFSRGIDGGAISRARKVIRRLYAEVASGTLDPAALRGALEDQRYRLESLQDHRAALIGWVQYTVALGLDPSPAAHLERMRAVTPAAVRGVGRRLALDTTFFLRPETP